MKSIGFVLVLSAALVACGGDNGGGGDAAPTGPCVGTYSMAWPSDEDPQFCMLPWDGTSPELGLSECGEILESCSMSGPTPDWSCIGAGTDGLPAEPSTITLTGFADVFSSGPNADKARIQVFRESQLGPEVTDPDSVTPIATYDLSLDATSLVEARACPIERDFNQGECIIPTDDCAGCDKVLGAGQFCHEGACEDLQRWEIRFSIPDIPTNEFLVFRTVGLDTDGQIQTTGNTWSPLFQYNIFLSTGDGVCADIEDTDCFAAGGTEYQVDVNLLSSNDYRTIPTSAGLSAGITEGNGGIAGEIHDCNGIRVRHSQVGFTRTRDPRVLVFFNGNPTKTLPQLSQSTQGTNFLGLYAGLDIPPGEVSIVAVGNNGGELLESSSFSARVWPNSITSLRLGGGRPAKP